ncbi:MAG: iron ABC transporter permease [Bacteroidetes bacterium]|nr:MAG: iron ABC transporter permease [Bacteroidota bacterium]
MQARKHIFIFLGIAVILLFLADIALGSVNISLSQLWAILKSGRDGSALAYIIWDIRLPKAIAAIMVGSGLSIAGLLLQSLFRNPLAGPSVLGISSGASLGVATYVMAGGMGVISYGLLSAGGLALFSILGSFLVLLVVMTISMKVNDTVSLLIVGMMFGSITSALVGVLQYFSSAELVQHFIIWTFGSLASMSWSELGLVSAVVLISSLFTLSLMKPLNALLLSDEYAESMGVSVKKTRNIIIIISSLIAGIITAFAGPIVFVGVAVPHLTRNLFRSVDHRILVPAVMLNGAILMLICDIISQLPGSTTVLPINSVTSLFGAPVVIWIILQNRKRT